MAGKKKCISCKRLQPLDDFVRNGRVRKTCQTCARDCAVRYQRRRSKLICPRCGEAKDRSEFRDAEGNRQSRCTACREYAASAGTRYCTGCKTHRDVLDFFDSIAGEERRTCKSCRAKWTVFKSTKTVRSNSALQGVGVRVIEDEKGNMHKYRMKMIPTTPVDAMETGNYEVKTWNCPEMLGIDAPCVI